jgi:hypothetical protein
LDHVKEIISVNIEKEQKLSLLKAKIEELKVWFSEKPLTELQKLKFVIETISEPTLEDINKKGSDSTEETTNHHNGIELPPKDGKENEKSEVV